MAIRDTWFYEQNFEAPGPLTPDNLAGVAPGSYDPPYPASTDGAHDWGHDPAPLATYPEVGFAVAANVFSGIGKDGSQALWSPIPTADDDLQPWSGCLTVAVMGDGRRPGWEGAPGGFAARNAISPLATQSAVNVVQMDVQFRSEAFNGYEGYPDGNGSSTPFYMSMDLGARMPIVLEIYHQYPETNKHQWALTTWDDYVTTDWTNEQFDLDGAFHTLRIEWKPSTYTFDSKEPALDDGKPTGNSDGWVKVSLDGVVFLESTNRLLLYYMSNTSVISASGRGYGIFNDGFESGNTLEQDGYTHNTGCTKAYHALTTATLGSEFARDISSLQTWTSEKYFNSIGGCVLREPTTNAGSCEFELDFSKASDGPRYFFAVRDDSNAPMLEFKRDGTTLIVDGPEGELAREEGVLVENAGAYPNDQNLHIKWCFSTYVDSVAQADGYVLVQKRGAWIGSPTNAYTWTTLLEAKDIVVPCLATQLPVYFTHLWWCPQGSLRYALGEGITIYERIRPEWINRYPQINLGYWAWCTVYDNIKCGVAVPYTWQYWIDIANGRVPEIAGGILRGGTGNPRVRGALWTGDPTAKIKARLLNVTTMESAGESDEVVSTVPVVVDFDVEVLPGLHDYKLQVISDCVGVDLFAAPAQLIV